MPNFRSGEVVEVTGGRAGLQCVTVRLDRPDDRDGPDDSDGEGGEPVPAPSYVLTGLTGPVEPGDRVVVNTTAVDLGLGTGGWHFVHWNLSRGTWVEPGPGHIMKLRYTSLQVDAGSVEEHDGALTEVTGIDRMPVVACALHSQLAPAAAAFKAGVPGATLAYVMTDGAALPLPLSHLVAGLRERGLLDATISAGHAFGGDHEAINLWSALAIARHVVGADAVLVAVGPGIVGTNTALGHTGLEVASAVDAAGVLGGRPVAALRVSFADHRPRHQGVSHHSRTALGLVSQARAVVPVPTLVGEERERVWRDLETSGIAARHDLVEIDPGDVLQMLARHDLEVSSMGRPAAADPALFACGAAAGAVAAGMLAGDGHPADGATGVGG